MVPWLLRHNVHCASEEFRWSPGKCSGIRGRHLKEIPTCVTIIDAQDNSPESLEEVIQRVLKEKFENRIRLLKLRERLGYKLKDDKSKYKQQKARFNELVIWKSRNNRPKYTSSDRNDEWNNSSHFNINDSTRRINCFNANYSVSTRYSSNDSS